MTKEDLLHIAHQIQSVDYKIEKAILKRWDSNGKPLEGLGLFEKIIARIGAIQHCENPKLNSRKVLLFFSDNGVTESGVSQSDISVTHKVGIATSNHNSTAYLMAQKAGIDLFPIDIGMKGDIISGFYTRRVSSGTQNIATNHAMTMEQCLQAIQIGYELVFQLNGGPNSTQFSANDLITNALNITNASEFANENSPIQATFPDIILLGEMGVANTTTATAVACAILGKDPLQFTGRGAGLSDEMLKHKVQVIKTAIDRHFSNSCTTLTDPDFTLSILASLGGYDIAGMVGSILACAQNRIPIVLDGLITLTAALVADRLFPGLCSHMIASHRPREKMGRLILSTLHLHAPISANLALGESTGAILLLPMLDVCLELFNKGITFNTLGMDAYTRYNKH